MSVPDYLTLRIFFIRMLITRLITDIGSGRRIRGESQAMVDPSERYRKGEPQEISVDSARRLVEALRG
jgi:hypothetical protein